MKTVSLHQTDKKNSLCVVLCFEGGKNWRLYASPVPHGRDCECPDISEENSVVLRERDLMKAVITAKKESNSFLKLKMKERDVELPVINVEEKIDHIGKMGLGHVTRTKRKRKKNSRV